MTKFVLLTLLSVIATAWGFSGGAPPAVCEDMTPKHLFAAQKTSSFPYKIIIEKPSISGGQSVNINISGEKSFKGFFLQVRDENNKAVGAFQRPSTDKKIDINYQTVTCNGNSASAVTHKNAINKNSVDLLWEAPNIAGKYQVLATVALNGSTYWVAVPSGIINVLSKK